LTGGHTFFDLYPLAVNLATKGGLSHFKEAVILPNSPDAAEGAKFWELACQNRGIQVRIFPDAKMAVAWLME